MLWYSVMCEWLWLAVRDLYLQKILQNAKGMETHYIYPRYSLLGLMTSPLNS